MGNGEVLNPIDGIVPARGPAGSGTKGSRSYLGSCRPARCLCHRLPDVIGLTPMERIKDLCTVSLKARKRARE